MPKNIVLLSDGTGNSAAKLSKTNVWRLYQALDLSNPDEQIACYDDGVGTSSFLPLAILGGAFGVGVKRNVLDLYTFACRNYADGDRIYCFGFSRGAFTARMVAGLIASEGLVQSETEKVLQKRAKTAYREYRRKHFSADIPIDQLGRWIRDLFVGDKHYNKRPCAHAPIHFLGLWDTVAAYGLPIDEMTRALNWFWRLYPKDRNLRPGINHVCHALALDDERYTFHPMLFNEVDEPQDKQSICDERITQVWFAGMHSNVGGGYPDDGLSYVPLAWMMDQAQKFDLKISAKDRDVVMAGANAVGTIYDSRRGLGGFYRYMPRKLLSFYQLPRPGNERRPGTGLIYDTLTPVFVPRPKIHESVFMRIAKGTNRYSPIVLPAFYEIVRRDGKIVPQGDELEDPTQAESRAHEQERVWNIVWRKRLVYFVTIFVALGLALFPLLLPAGGACKWPTCVMSPAIGLLAALLPNFAAPWIAAYQTHPGIFLGMALAFGGLLYYSSQLQQQISDDMHSIWYARIRGPRTAVEVKQPPSDALFKTRSAPLYDRFFITLKFKLLPAAFLLISLAVIGGLVSRGLFNSLSSAGLFCSEESLSAHTVNDLFPARSVCWAVPTLKRGNVVPFSVEKGKRYVIHLNVVNKDDYKDATIPAGLGGFGPSEMPWKFRIAQPIAVFIRRAPGENWFKPIIRIGNRGTEEYALNPSDGSEATWRTTGMSSAIVAKQTGPLYMFVNDGVLPMPLAWWPPALRFYDNNHGEVRVSVCTTGVVPATPGTGSDAGPESGCICNNSLTKEAAPGRNCW